MVMCKLPAMRAPFRGLEGAYFLRMAMSPGISCSAMAISFRPQSARLRSATTKSLAGGEPFSLTSLADSLGRDFLTVAGMRDLLEIDDFLCVSTWLCRPGFLARPVYS